MYKPKFTITPQINSQIAEIERLRMLIDRSKILPTKEVILHKRALTESTRSSTGIEGNPLNEKEVAKVLSGQKIVASERFVTEVSNYKKALDFIEKRAAGNLPLSIKDILDIHKIVMQNLLPETKVGKLRKTPIFIVDLSEGKEILRYRGPNYKKVQILIEELLSWLNNNKELHPILIAGILHYEFVSIHPFADGNGRVTRLLTMLFLYLQGYTFRKVLVPDRYYFSNTSNYYAALNRADNYNDRRSIDITPWLKYFIEGFLFITRDLLEKVTTVSLEDGSKKVITLTDEDYQIIDLITSLGKVAISDVVSNLSIPKRTAQRRLSRMVEENLIKRLSKGRSANYEIRI